MSSGRPAAEALALIETGRRRRGSRQIKLWAAAGLITAFYVACWRLAQIDPLRLVSGLPRLGRWLAEAWPPQFDDLPLILQRTAETIAMAAMGTTIATLLAVPTAVLASRNITPVPLLYFPLRWFLNMLRGIDSFVFALLFVAAVGLGPFAGVLGIGLHTWGSSAKLIADQIETVQLDPLRAVETTGAGRITAIVYALLPDIAPAVSGAILA